MLFWVRSDSNKVVLIPNVYLHVWYIIISLKDSFGPPKTSKTHFVLKLSLYNKFCLNRGFEGLFWLRSYPSKAVLIPNVYLHIYCIIRSLMDSLGAQQALKTHFALKQIHYKYFCRNWAFHWIFWFWSDSSKVFLIPNVYLNI